MEILGVSAVTLIVTQALKMAFSLKKNILPLVSLIVGCLVVLALWFTQDAVFTWDAVVNTFIAIATANGIYSGVKATINK